MQDSSLNDQSTTKQIIEAVFSSQWCKENLVVPLGMQIEKFTGRQMMTIAIGSFSYLSTIGEFIKYRLSQSQIEECLFIEMSAEEIQDLLQ